MSPPLLRLGSLLLWLPFTSIQAAEAVRFNAGFLNQEQGSVDLARFAEGTPLVPGIYPSDLYVNQQWVGQGLVRLQATTASEPIQPCLSDEMVQLAQLKPALMEPHLSRLQEQAACITPDQIHRSISWHYDMGSMALELTIPQSLQSITRRGETDPRSALIGEPVASLGYNLNSYHTVYDCQHQQNQYLGLNGGANLGRWRLRHQSSLSEGDNGSGWNNIATYAERSLVDWESHLRLGQGWTSGEFFDSMGYQGASLATDSRMLPSSRRGFAPTVRGNARTHARVTVEQNNTLLYETTVPPGSFVIDDLYPTGYGGDLLVTIHEADGQQQQFRIPYAAVPGLMRDGTTFYSATLGKIHENGLTQPAPAFGELTVQHGFNNLLSGYGGVNAMEGYSALLLGGALNTEWGALSLDATRSTLNGSEGKQQGTRYRATYNKTLNQSGTQFSLSTSKAADDSYFSPRDALWQLDGSTTTPSRVAKRADLSLNQPIGRGSLYLLGSKSWYWQEQEPQTSLQLGYSNNIGKVNYQLSVQQVEDSAGEQNRIYGLTLSMPLGTPKGSSLNLQLNQDPGNGTQLQGSLTGTAGSQSELNYGLTASRYAARQEQDLSSVGANGSYRSRVAYLDASLSRDNQQAQQYSLGLRGALVAHSGGVIATPELGDTFAIVEAPAAEGAGVGNRVGNRVNASGYAIVPHLTPFEPNRIDLDPEGTADTVEIASTSLSVIPDAGAAVKVTFPTRVGYGLLVDTRLPDGRSTPFGAEVSDETGTIIGSVGQGGQLYARVSQHQGRLVVRWGSQADQRCQIQYQLPAGADGFTTLSGSRLCNPLLEETPNGKS